MEITQVKVHKVDREDSKLKAYVTVTIDDCFVIHNIRIIEGEGKLFIAMPSRKISEDRYEDIAHPINKETREMFEEKIFAEYNNPTPED